MTEYRTVGIPKSIADKLEKCVGHGGWRSVTEIILYCVRQRMYEFDQLLVDIEEEAKLAAEQSN